MEVPLEITPETDDLAAEVPDPHRPANPSIKQRLFRFVLFTILGMPLVYLGCQRHHLVSLDQIIRLDGFNGQGGRNLTDLFGQRIVFTNQTPITFFLKDGRKLSYVFTSIVVDSTRFTGTTCDGRVISGDLVDVEKVTVTIPTPGRAAGMTVAIVLGAAAAAGIVVGCSYLAYLFLGFLICTCTDPKDEYGEDIDCSLTYQLREDQGDRGKRSPWMVSERPRIPSHVDPDLRQGSPDPVLAAAEQRSNHPTAAWPDPIRRPDPGGSRILPHCIPAGTPGPAGAQ